jgi:hypothetical protein
MITARMTADKKFERSLKVELEVMCDSAAEIFEMAASRAHDIGAHRVGTDPRAIDYRPILSSINSTLVKTCRQKCAPSSPTIEAAVDRCAGSIDQRIIESSTTAQDVHGSSDDHQRWIPQAQPKETPHVLLGIAL